MIFRRTFHSLGALAAVGALTVGAAVVGVGSAPFSAPPTAHAECGLGSGGEFHALNPARIHDTRNGLNDPVSPGKKATGRPGAEYAVQIAGEGGVPANAPDVLAVVLTVTVADPTVQGNLAVRPSGAPVAPSSLVNFSSGRNVPNMAISGVGPDGKAIVRLFGAPGGRAHVIIDVSGWISTSCYGTSGARFVPAGPGRIKDTRAGASGPLAAGRDLKVQVRGAASTNPPVNPIVPPSDDVTAVMLNLTAENRQPSSRFTNLAVTPNPLPAGQRASTSNLNVAPQQVKATMVIAPIGSDGSVTIRNLNGNVHVVVDVLGYFEQRPTDASETGRIIPLSAPFRAFDTRQGAFGGAPLGTGSRESWSFQAFAGSVTLPSAGGAVTLDQQSAIIGNLTGTQLTRTFPTSPVRTFLSAYPGGANRPDSSNLNVPEGENVPNMSLLRYGTAAGDPYVVQTYNHRGSLHYILDVYAIVLK